MPASDCSAVSRWGIPTVVCWQSSSASPLCFDIIACCPTHPPFNHRRSSFSGRCCPTVEHSAALASSMYVFGKRLKTHLFSHSYPKYPAVPAQCHFRHYNRSLYLLTYLQHQVSNMQYYVTMCLTPNRFNRSFSSQIALIRWLIVFSHSVQYRTSQTDESDSFVDSQLSITGTKLLNTESTPSSKKKTTVLTFRDIFVNSQILNRFARFVSCCIRTKFSTKLCSIFPLHLNYVFAVYTVWKMQTYRPCLKRRANDVGCANSVDLCHKTI